MAGTSWILVRTQGHREKWAAENIRQQGCNVYLPMIAQAFRPRGGISLAKFVPLFPSYLFVEIENAWRFLLGTYGVLGVVLNGGYPARVRTSVIREIQQREDPQEGCVVLPTPARYNLNDRIRVANGPFAGVTGLYAGQTAQNRVRVLLDCLGSKRPIILAEHHIEAA